MKLNSRLKCEPCTKFSLSCCPTDRQLFKSQFYCDVSLKYFLLLLYAVSLKRLLHKRINTFLIWQSHDYVDDYLLKHFNRNLCVQFLNWSLGDLLFSWFLFSWLILESVMSIKNSCEKTLKKHGLRKVWESNAKCDKFLTYISIERRFYQIFVERFDWNLEFESKGLISKIYLLNDVIQKFTCTTSRQLLIHFQCIDKTSWQKSLLIVNHIRKNW